MILTAPTRSGNTCTCLLGLSNGDAIMNAVLVDDCGGQQSSRRVVPPLALDSCQLFKMEAQIIVKNAAMADNYDT